MRITKFTHACVRLDSLVIDPGIWSDDVPLADVSAILVTHEHLDHVDPARLAGVSAPIFAPAGADLNGLPFTPVTTGSTFDAGGLRVRAFGDRHAITADGQPDCANLGYLVEDEVYHPGDALAVPGVPVGTLLVPAGGPWMKLGDAIAFAREVAPARAVQIHDAQLSARGMDVANGWFEECLPGYTYLRDGESLSS